MNYREADSGPVAVREGIIATISWLIMEDRWALHPIPRKAVSMESVDASVLRSSSRVEHHYIWQGRDITPTLTGAQPAMFKLNGQTI